MCRLLRRSAVVAQLCPPKNAYKKYFDIMLHLEAEWPSKKF